MIIRLGGGQLLPKMPSIKSLKQVNKLRDEDPHQCKPGKTVFLYTVDIKKVFLHSKSQYCNFSSVIVLSSTEKSEHEHIRILRDADISCYSPELVLSASLKQVIELGPHLIRENGKSY